MSRIPFFLLLLSLSTSLLSAQALDSRTLIGEDSSHFKAPRANSQFNQIFKKQAKQELQPIQLKLLQASLLYHDPGLIINSQNEGPGNTLACLQGGEPGPFMFMISPLPSRLPFQLKISGFWPEKAISNSQALPDSLKLGLSIAPPTLARHQFSLSGEIQQVQGQPRYFIQAWEKHKIHKTPFLFDIQQNTELDFEDSLKRLFFKGSIKTLFQKQYFFADYRIQQFIHYNQNDNFLLSHLQKLYSGISLKKPSLKAGPGIAFSANKDNIQFRPQAMISCSPHRDWKLGLTLERKLDYPLFFREGRVRFKKDIDYNLPFLEDSCLAEILFFREKTHLDLSAGFYWGELARLSQPLSGPVYSYRIQGRANFQQQINTVLGFSLRSMIDFYPEDFRTDFNCGFTILFNEVFSKQAIKTKLGFDIGQAAFWQEAGYSALNQDIQGRIFFNLDIGPYCHIFAAYSPGTINWSSFTTIRRKEKL